MNRDDDIKLGSSRQILLSVLGIAILLIAVVGISFAAFNYTKAGTRENTIKTGTVTMSYDEATNGINISNAVPMNEATALATYTGNSAYVENGEGTYNYGTPADSTNTNTSVSDNVFDFTVSLTTKGSATATYDVSAVKAPHTTVDADCNAAAYAAAGRINTASEHKVGDVKTAAQGTEGQEGYVAPTYYTSADSDAGLYAACSLVSDSDVRLWLGKYNASSSAGTEDGKYEAVAIPNKTTGTGLTSSAWVSNSGTASANGTPASTASDDYMILYTGSITATSSNGSDTTTQDKFRLKMWVDEAYIVDGNSRSYTVKVNVYAKS